MTLLTSFIQLALSKKRLPRSTQTGDDRLRWKRATDSPFGIGSDFLRLFSSSLHRLSLAASGRRFRAKCFCDVARTSANVSIFFPSVNFSLITHEFDPICTGRTGKMSIFLRRKQHEAQPGFRYSQKRNNKSELSIRGALQQWQFNESQTTSRQSKEQR